MVFQLVFVLFDDSSWLVQLFICQIHVAWGVRMSIKTQSAQNDTGCLRVAPGVPRNCFFVLLSLCLLVTLLIMCSSTTGLPFIKSAPFSTFLAPTCFLMVPMPSSQLEVWCLSGAACEPSAGTQGKLGPESCSNIPQGTWEHSWCFIRAW